MKNVVGFDRLSKRKQSAIRQASREWTTHLRTKGKKTGQFVRRMEQLGWVNMHSGGAYKTALCKNNIVIKFATNQRYREAQQEVSREFEQWKTVPSSFKRHLPKVHLYNNGMLVQDRVMVTCDWGCAKANKIATKFKHLYDYDHNHGHSVAGTVKFFDWVYNRTWDIVDDPNTPLVKKKRKKKGR